MALHWRTTESTSFGTGWLSGLLGAILGLVGLGAVLCFRFPEWLTVPEARALYPLPLVRALLHAVLVSGFLLGVLSLTLRRNKALGTVAVGATLIAAVLGGSQVPVQGEPAAGPFLGLDWFVLSLILYSAVFIPLERLFARIPEQPLFRDSWPTDGTRGRPARIITQTVALTPGTRLGVYEIAAQIGEGGMGEVYRARDTQLDRDVAIEILPEAFAADAGTESPASTREAKVLAALNHPNIATIHGLETRGRCPRPCDGAGAGGATSRSASRAGAIPLDEALPDREADRRRARSARTSRASSTET